MKYRSHYRSPLGDLWLGEENGYLTHLVFHEQDKRLQDFTVNTTPFCRKVVEQLEEYFAGERKTFQIPIKLEGTDFQLKVWQKLQCIPYGATKNYQQIAQLVDNPRGSRAVGLANGRNPISIIVPCHRVIGKQGTLTGYAGGLSKKQFLLDLEQRYV